MPRPMYSVFLVFFDKKFIRGSFCRKFARNLVLASLVIRSVVSVSDKESRLSAAGFR